MPDISTRINALISYLFLGPIILLARAGTPLAHPYVNGHAKRASLYMLIGLISYIAYKMIYPYIPLNIFGFSLQTILLTVIMSIMLISLLSGAYNAYRGISASESIFQGFTLPTSTIIEGDYSEEDKIRIVASFVPFFGMYIASKYPRKETQIGSKISSIFTIIILAIIVFLAGTITTLSLIITIGYIILIVTTVVQLFGFSRFLEFGIYKKIPNFLEFDAHIKASIVSVFDFFRVAFGGAVRSTYREKYEIYLQINLIEKKATTPYFMPVWIISVPFINLITLPSLWQSKYKEYIPLILQGFTLTLIMSIIVWQYTNTPIWLYLGFTIVTLATESMQNILVRAPFTSVIVDFYLWLSQSKKTLETYEKTHEEKVEYKYEVEEK